MLVNHRCCLRLGDHHRWSNSREVRLWFADTSVWLRWSNNTWSENLSSTGLFICFSSDVRLAFLFLPSPMAAIVEASVVSLMHTTKSHRKCACQDRRTSDRWSKKRFALSKRPDRYAFSMVISGWGRNGIGILRWSFSIIFWLSSLMVKWPMNGRLKKPSSKQVIIRYLSWWLVSVTDLGTWWKNSTIRFRRDNSIIFNSSIIIVSFKPRSIPMLISLSMHLWRSRHNMRPSKISAFSKTIDLLSQLFFCTRTQYTHAQTSSSWDDDSLERDW